MAKDILIIENEGLIAGFLSRSLSQKGYGITVLEPKEVLSRVRRRRTSLVILEAPGSQAEAVRMCRSVRDMATAPIIALVEPPVDLEELDGVECLAKPLDFRELLVVVEYALSHDRKRTKRKPRVLRSGDLSLDLRTQRLTRGEHRYHLTPKEFALLRMFMSSPGQVLSHRAIMKEVWDTAYLDDLRTLYVHVSWLRKKIEDDPKQPAVLRAVRGVGYRFEGKS